MKNQLIYILLGVLLLASSCAKDFLTVDPVDQLVVENFYKNEDEVRASTALLYGGLGWFDYISGLMWYVGDMAAGDMYYTYDQEGQFYYFSYNNGNTHLTRGWQSLYRIGSYCNSVINDMPGAASKNGVAEGVINAAVAEARFNRAWVYFILAEYWNEVPIIANASELVANNNMQVPKNTRKSIYEFIRRDLEFAEANLPGNDVQAGRATKWAAKGLLAKLYLTMASNLSDPNSSDYFNKAKDYAQQVINNSDGFGLNASYSELFTIAGNNNKESLYALQMIGAGGYGLGSNRNVSWSRNSIIADQTWGAGKGPTLDFQDELEPNDARRKYIIMQLGDYYPELDKADGGYTYNIRTVDPSDPSVAVEDANPMLSHIKKYVIGKAADNDGLVGTDQDAGNNVYFMRFAEMYLIYCEAAIGAGTETSDPLAIQYINLIRDRAQLPSKIGSISFDDVMKERRIEFGMESIRWFDVKRMFYRNQQLAVDYLNNQHREIEYAAKFGVSDAETLNSYDGYERVSPSYTIQVYASQIAKFPIPAEALVSNPLLADEMQAEDYVFTDEK